MQMKSKKQARLTRVRASLRSSGRARLSVIRSNKHIWAQLIDDATGTTIAAANSKAVKGTKTETATAVGKAIAEAALAKKVTKVVFDRGSYQYHGRVKALAEAARTAGLEF